MQTKTQIYELKMFEIIKWFKNGNASLCVTSQGIEFTVVGAEGVTIEIELCRSELKSLSRMCDHAYKETFPKAIIPSTSLEEEQRISDCRRRQADALQDKDYPNCNYTGYERL